MTRRLPIAHSVSTPFAKRVPMLDRSLPACLTRGCFGLTAVIVLATATAPRLSAQLVMVVNSANRAEDISADRLKRLFLGLATTFHEGGHARLATHVPSADQFDRAALGLAREVVRSRWMAMTFRGEATSVPADFATADEVKRFVKEHLDAIAFLPLAEADATVKMLRIDGKRATDAGYLLR